MQSRVTGLHVPIRHAWPGAKQRLNPNAIAQHPLPQSLSVVQVTGLIPASASFGWHTIELALQLALVPHAVHAAPAVPCPHCVFDICDGGTHVVPSQQPLQLFALQVGCVATH